MSRLPFGEQLASAIRRLLLERVELGDGTYYRLTKEAIAAINYRRGNGIFTPPLTKVMDALVEARNAIRGSGEGAIKNAN